jgi:hypothetical protein
MRWIFLALVIAASGCGSKPPAAEDFGIRVVSLPGGQKIRAEVMIRQEDMERGMMFRDSLAPDRGMLFLHSNPGKYSYWMHNCLIPLDIIWMDSEHRIQEISANTPPCKTEPDQCPQYGGNYESWYVLELASGMAARYGLKPGDTLDF